MHNREKLSENAMANGQPRMGEKFSLPIVPPFVWVYAAEMDALREITQRYLLV